MSEGYYTWLMKRMWERSWERADKAASNDSDFQQRLKQGEEAQKGFAAALETVTSSDTTTAPPVQPPAQPSKELNGTARNLESYRKKCGLTKNRLIKEVGIDRKTVFAHLSGKTTPSPESLKAYADVFTDHGCPISADSLLSE